MPRLKLDTGIVGKEFEQLFGHVQQPPQGLLAARDVKPGACPRDAVLQIDKTTLFRYRPRTKKRHGTPLLIVYALVNRPDMADLQSGRSLIESLLDRGLDIFLIDWGTPDGGDREIGLDDYIDRYIDGAVDEVCRLCGVDAINVLGICQGGTFSLCYTALHGEKVRNLITTVTPVDFHTPDDMLSHLFREVDAELLAASSGNIPGDLLNMMFLLLKPFTLAQQKYVHLADSLQDEEAMQMFVRMEKWIFDSPPLAGRAFVEFATGCYQRNALIAGNFAVGGRRVDLGAITQPVLNIYARDDHLVPPAASLALGNYVGSEDYECFEFPGGHIGIYVSSRAGEMVATIDDWLAAR